MTGLPTVTVKLDDGTGTYPTDITAYVELDQDIDVSEYGRSDEFGQPQGTGLTLTLDNTTARFTNGTVSIAPGTPIRYTETLGATTYIRFTGRVTTLTQGWPGGGQPFATLEVSAQDGLADLSRRPMRSLVEEENLLRSPTAYYTLSEAQGSTSAGDTSGNQAPVLTINGGGTALTFGNGIGPVDGLSAVQMASGQFLDSGLTATTFITPSTPFTISAFVVVPSTPGGKYVVVNATNGAFFFDSVDLGVDNFGHLELDLNTGGSGDVAVGSINVCDGNLHHIAATFDGSNVASVYVDGVLDHTLTGVFNEPVAPLTQLRIGRADLGEKFTGTVSHVAVINGTALTAGQIAAIANVGLGLTETTDARLTRIANYVGITPTSTSPSGQLMELQQTADQAVADALQDVVTAEGGVLFIDGSGTLTMQGRNYRAVRTTADLTLGDGEAGEDTEVAWDQQQKINQVTVTRTGGAGQVVNAAEVIASRNTPVYPQSLDLAVAADADAISAAQWLVAKHTTTTPRLGSVTFDLMSSSAAAGLFDLDIGDRISLPNLPNQQWPTAGDYTIEGMSRSLGIDHWTITVNLLPWSLFQAWILGDATYSVLGSTTIPGY